MHIGRSGFVLEASPIQPIVKLAPVFLLCLATLVAFFLWPQAPLLEESEVQVRVHGPDGVWFLGNVTAETAFDAIAAVATSQGWTAVIDGRVGECTAYVKELRGVGEEGAGGWVFEIKRNGTWLGELVGSADCTALQPGDLVWWHWSKLGTYVAEKEWEREEQGEEAPSGGNQTA